MLRDPSPKQHALEMVTIEELVPADHLLRKIARHIDFEFWISVSPTRCLMPQHSAKTGAADLLIAILNKSSLMASSSKP